MGGSFAAARMGSLKVRSRRARLAWALSFGCLGQRTAHVWQFGCLSAQSYVSRRVSQKRQTRHDWGQVISMAVLLVSHAPALARRAQSSPAMSEQGRSMPVRGGGLRSLLCSLPADPPNRRRTNERRGAQASHETGQDVLMYLGLASHSPSLAQSGQEGSLSKQSPGSAGRSAGGEAGGGWCSSCRPPNCSARCIGSRGWARRTSIRRTMLQRISAVPVVGAGPGVCAGDPARREQRQCEVPVFRAFMEVQGDKCPPNV
jgi:hypothetical protein